MVVIYALVEPRDGQTRYVGKSKSPWSRYQIHCRYRHKVRAHCGTWLRALRRLGLKPHLRIIDWVEAHCWEQAERHYIALARQSGCALTNMQRGGSGSNVRRSNKRPDMAERNRARVWTPEMRAKVAAASARQVHSAETRAKYSAARIGRRLSQQTRSRMSELCTLRERSGRRHLPSKLNPATVTEVRRRAAAGETTRRLAADYGVSGTTIDALIQRTLCAWVDDGVPAQPARGPAVGERNGGCKISAEQVREIRRLYREKQANQVQLAARFGIDQTSVSQIILRRSWSHVPD